MVTEEKIQQTCKELLKKESDAYQGTMVSADYVYKDYSLDKKVYVYIADEDGSALLVTYRLDFMGEKVLGRTTYRAGQETVKGWFDYASM